MQGLWRSSLVFGGLVWCLVAVSCEGAAPVAPGASGGGVGVTEGETAPLAALSADERWALSGSERPGEVVAEDEVTVVNFYDGRLSLHLWEEGLGIDLGHPMALKYVQGLWRAPWLGAERVSDAEAEAAKLPWLAGRWLVWNEGQSASLRFPVPEGVLGDASWVLLVRLRPKVNRRVEVRLNGHGAIATVELSPAWQTVRVPVPPGALVEGGENTLTFVFAGSYFEGAHRVAARFDQVRLVRREAAEGLEEAAVLQDIGLEEARVLGSRRRALALGSPLRVDAYVVVPQGARFVAEVAPGPWSQQAPQLRIEARCDDGREVVIWADEVEPGSGWRRVEADLSALGGQAVRLTFAVTPGAQGATGRRPAVYLGEPRLVLSRGALAPVADAERPTDVLVVAVDALRADRLLLPREPAVAPHLAAAAERGLAFTALGAGSGSVVPMVSLLTGTQPDRHGVLDTETHVRTSLVTLGEAAAEAGWATRFYSTNPFVVARRGFTQGFAHYRNLTEEEGVAARTDVLVDEVIRDLSAAGAGHSLVVVHLAGLRLPHQPTAESLARFHPEPYTGAQDAALLANPVTLTPPLALGELRYLRALYDAELHDIDGHLGRLLTAWQVHKPGGMVVVLGTHGEALGESPAFGYGGALEAEVLRLPVIMGCERCDWPRGQWPGLVELIDVHQTIVDAVGWPHDESYQGRSLLDLVRQGLWRETFVACAQRSTPQRALAVGDYHYTLRGGDNDALQHLIEESLGGPDLRAQLPIAHRAMRDALVPCARWGERWDKKVWGDYGAPKEAFMETVAAHGW